MHRAPSIPIEFLRIEPYIIPISNIFNDPFFIKSYNTKDKPISLIMLLAMFRLYIFDEFIKLLTACIPYSEIELSAKLMVLNF